MWHRTPNFLAAFLGGLLATLIAGALFAQSTSNADELPGPAANRFDLGDFELDKEYRGVNKSDSNLGVRENFKLDVDLRLNSFEKDIRGLSRTLENFHAARMNFEKAVHGGGAGVGISDYYAMLGYNFSSFTLSPKGSGLFSASTGLPATIDTIGIAPFSSAQIPGGRVTGANPGLIIQSNVGGTRLVEPKDYRFCIQADPKGQIQANTSIGIEHNGICTATFDDLILSQVQHQKANVAASPKIDVVDWNSARGKELAESIKRQGLQEFLHEKPVRASGPIADRPVFDQSAPEISSLEMAGPQSKLPEMFFGEYCRGIKDTPSRMFEAAQYVLRQDWTLIKAAFGDNQALQEAIESGRVPAEMIESAARALILLSPPPPFLTANDAEEWRAEQRRVIADIEGALSKSWNDFSQLAEEQQAQILARGIGGIVGDGLFGAASAKALQGILGARVTARVEPATAEPVAAVRPKKVRDLWEPTFNESLEFVDSVAGWANKHFHPGWTRFEARTINGTYPSHISDPWLLGTEVIEGCTKTAERFVRVHGPNNQVREWVVRKESIAGLSPAQIKTKLNLKYEPTHISDVVVPEKTLMRRGLANPNFGGNPGAVQYEIVMKPSDPEFEKWFLRARPLK